MLVGFLLAGLADQKERRLMAILRRLQGSLFDDILYTLFLFYKKWRRQNINSGNDSTIVKLVINYH